MRKLSLFTAILFSVMACQQASDDASFEAADTGGYEDYAGQQASSVPETDGQAKQPASADPRKIIRTANLRMQVEDVKTSSEKIESLVESYDGFIGSMDWTNSSYQVSSNFTIKVPSGQFQSLLAVLEEEGTFIENRKIYAKDVTEEFVDIETRLKTKKEVRDRYVDILRNKAKTVEEVLQAEDAIRVIQEEIEAREGRLKYLRDQVALSTINLVIYQEVEYRQTPVTYAKPFGARLLSGLKNGWELILSLLVWGANIWPLLLLGGLIIWQRKRIFRRK